MNLLLFINTLRGWEPPASLLFKRTPNRTVVKNSQASLLFILLINIYVKNFPLHLIILK